MPMMQTFRRRSVTIPQQRKHTTSSSAFPRGEVRPVDGLQYIAGYSDLIDAFGANAAAGVSHYGAFGQAEGREPDTFNAAQYLANYGDLQAAFGNDLDAAAQHFILYGHAEGRTDHALPTTQFLLLAYAVLTTWVRNSKRLSCMLSFSPSDDNRR